MGDFRSTTVGATGINTDDRAHPDEFAEQLFYWLAELEGFDASRCGAGCDGCGGRWLADSGSWHFLPDDSAGDGWYFDDADKFDDDGTIACPSCGAGRVGFMVF